MKRPLGRPGVVAARHRAAFTIIELLAVMAIILVLAGLILNIAGSAQYNSAKARATSEIKAMETALESYKTDNGAYPSDPASSEQLDPQMSFEPTQGTYLKSSEFLYQQLAGLQPSQTTAQKTYMQFKPQQLHLASDATTTTVSATSPYMYIIDPFGFSYGYSTIYATKAAANNAKSPPDTSAITVGYNPTFDLWSTGGYSSSGKALPTTVTGSTNAQKYSSLWIKNW